MIVGLYRDFSLRATSYQVCDGAKMTSADVGILLVID